MVAQKTVQPQIKRCLIGQVSHAHGAPPDLVLIGRANAAPGGADLCDAHLRLARPVQLAMHRQDQRRVFGNHQGFGRHGDALFGQLFDFGQQSPGIQHHAIADDAQLAAAHDAAGQKRQLVDHAVDDKRMARIMAALEPGDHIGPLGQPIDDLALPLVAPLGAHDDDIGHWQSLRLSKTVAAIAFCPIRRNS